MRMTFVAAAVAVLAFLMPAAGPAQATGQSPGYAAGLAQVDIPRVKSVLNLTPAQQLYWPAVETALRAIARRQARSEPAGFLHRISHRVVSIVLNGAAIKRLATAARPLVATLSDDQRRSARTLAEEMGLGAVVAALN